jgi:hypothetical protein
VVYGKFLVIKYENVSRHTLKPLAREGVSRGVDGGVISRF